MRRVLQLNSAEKLLEEGFSPQIVAPLGVRQHEQIMNAMLPPHRISFTSSSTLQALEIQYY